MSIDYVLKVDGFVTQERRAINTNRHSRGEQNREGIGDLLAPTKQFQQYACEFNVMELAIIFVLITYGMKNSIGHHFINIHHKNTILFLFQKCDIDNQSWGFQHICSISSVVVMDIFVSLCSESMFCFPHKNAFVSENRLKI